ncbi:hypothetical protein CMI37_24705 [Candidatus Pacearchaeota archaeon]|nr:hypothetical protein [Candidatus Pacearchaeota archaeon]
MFKVGDKVRHKANPLHWRGVVVADNKNGKLPRPSHYITVRLITGVEVNVYPDVLQFDCE